MTVTKESKMAEETTSNFEATVRDVRHTHARRTCTSEAGYIFGANSSRNC